MKLDDFSKITHNGKEIDKVLHQGKTIWQKQYEYEKYNTREISVPIEEEIPKKQITFHITERNVPAVGVWYKHSDGYEYLVDSRSTSPVSKYIISYRRRHYETEKAKGDFISIVHGYENEYPLDGLHTDGFWYLRK